MSHIETPDNKVSDENALKYRPCVGLLILNPEGKIFIGQRTDHTGAWQMPQGGIDTGEDVEQAIFRELEEETGINSNIEIIKIMPERLRYNFPEHMHNRLYEGQYIGQEQVWAALRFSGNDNQINLENHHQREFIAWKWADRKELLPIIVNFKLPTYHKVFDYFEEYLA